MVLPYEVLSQKKKYLSYDKVKLAGVGSLWGKQTPPERKENGEETSKKQPAGNFNKSACTVLTLRL